MGTTIGQQLRACGRKTLPDRIQVGPAFYRLAQVFKHDFFAATGLYELQKPPKSGHQTPHPRLVLKIARTGDLIGLPLTWLGEWLCSHESDLLEHLATLPGLPKLLTRYGRTGLIYPFIPGVSLDQRPQMPDNFFDNLQKLLENVHQRRVVYLDMNKRGNILLTEKGLPALIDFQIALRIPKRLAGSRRIADGLLRSLAREDLYHLKKHQRRLRPDLMSTEQRALSRRHSRWITLHRVLARPFTQFRRRLLARLYAKGLLCNDASSPPNSETDPKRWRRP